MIADIAEDQILAKEPVLDLLVTFAFIDGELHDKEHNALKEICLSLDIPEADLAARIAECKTSTEPREKACQLALEAIGTQYARERLIGFLCDIATADGFHDQKELRFLNTIKDMWGLNISIGRQLKWDEDQKAVIHANYQERMIVYAGPGMGKTAVACARVSDLIDQNVEPSNIWMLSFTRTAVKEIRDRISCFAGQNLSALGVKVTTIDSKAWRIRYGLTEEEIQKLFGGYEKNIEEVIKLFTERKEALFEHFEGLEHVIIDEAQDITGVRAELIIQILKLLNPSCGFTIFADPAQAIYGFTDDLDGKQPEDRLNFLELTKKEFADGLQEKELKTIHRTNNPKLIKLIEDLRLDIYVNDNVNESVYSDRENFIKSQADKEAGEFNSQEISNQNNTLVLFRRRSEVLRASSFACADGVSHRIRMSGHPTGVFSWIGHIFSDYPSKQINKDVFIKLCEERKALFDEPTGLIIYEEWWQLLLTVAEKGNAVDVSRLRIVCSRSPAPIQLCYSELGTHGPILGTIHASKGREADNVILRLPFRPANAQAFNYGEESRVLYVGATRAKGELTVGKGFTGQSFAKSTDSGRVFRGTRKESGYCLATVEIGLNNELNEYSFVSRKRSMQDVQESQRRLSELLKNVPCPLQASCEKQGDEYIYSIWTSFAGKDVDKIIGEFDQSLNKDLFRIARAQGRYITPKKVTPFFMLGLRTVCKSENDPGLQTVHAPYSNTGFWLVPVLVGYPSCLFPLQRG